MSTRYEFFAAKQGGVSVELWDAEAVRAETDEDLPEGHYGLTIGGDEVAVVAGTLVELEAFAQRLLGAVQTAQAKALPELPGGSDTCPHVYTEEEAEAYRQDCREWNRRGAELHGDAFHAVDVEPRWKVGDVCGAALLLWELEPMRRYLEWVEEDGEAGHWVAGPSKFGDGGETDGVNCDNMHYWAVPDIEDWQ